ncbi:LLM class flavin-dependent oxidoreductase [Actinomadura parmotrematis]|uniref:LLM class flavin-dependent oxidoreductase n=1 Tax=Actinomadura parmotrematis TaxID=2864039 RepID=A0ABS7G2I5_9ACTN|nr:LLM class flavin-dependent oxidoreductase [Actinomadura parmotrematis]MBW8485858.1 LLM class flavin-dependent oxidoreductase [Actinomadura parmotrematis]
MIGGAPADRYAGPLLGSPNRLKLAVFSANMAGGANLTHAPEAPQGTWTESVRIAQAADRAGIEALIPVARWRGMAAPARREAHRSFESFTWAAGIAAVTGRIQVFATFHIPVTHPVAAAKQIATVDHISGGRFAVNVVAGWNEDEFGMFGLEQREHDDRYAVADEWTTFLKRIWAAEEEFDFTGRYFTARRVLSEPKPVQRGRPVIMNAGFSPAGRDFAARHADLTFAMVPGVEQAARVVPELKAQVERDHGRKLSVFAGAHVVCAGTEDEARRAYARMVDEVGDREAAANAIRLLIPNSASGDFDADGMAAAAIAGFFALPLVGTPDSVVAQMAELADAGLDGLALSWLDYHAGLDQYVRELRPRLIAAGLRER